MDRFRSPLRPGQRSLHADARSRRRQEGREEEELDRKPTALKGGGKHAVRFADVDQRLTVWVDDLLPFGDGVTYAPPATEGPTEANDLQPAGVG